MKNIVYTIPSNNLEELRHIIAAFNNFHPDLKAIGDISRRVQLCINQNGGHFMFKFNKVCLLSHFKFNLHSISHKIYDHTENRYCIFRRQYEEGWK